MIVFKNRLKYPPLIYKPKLNYNNIRWKAHVYPVTTTNGEAININSDTVPVFIKQTVVSSNGSTDWSTTEW